MWTTVLALALLLNMEPLRVGLVHVMLGRPRPQLQLFAFFCGGLLTAGSVGLLVLFVFHRSPLGSDFVSGPKVQICLGVIALVLAAVLALRPARSQVGPPVDGEPAPVGRTDTMSARAGELLRRSTSPAWAAAIGILTALPSGDFLAVLLVIGSSGAVPLAQAGAVLLFHIVGNAVTVVSLISFLVAPKQAHGWNDRFQGWVKSRTRREYACFIAVAGVFLILVGWWNL